MKQWKPPPGWERAVYVLMLLQMMLGVVYGTLSGPYLGFEILLCVGWLVLVVGFLFFILGPYELRKKGGAPKGASIVLTRVLVDSGVYAVVCHPQTLGFILLMSASILVSQHWFSVVLSVPIIVYAYVTERREEESNIEKFGDDYKRYMQRVPRNNVLVGILRVLRRRKEYRTLKP